MSAGYVYILSNPSMPFIVKIGYSRHGGQSRADVFYRNDTAVATPFKVEFQVYCNNAPELERVVHEELGHCRVNPSREFFECSVATAVKSISSFLAGSLDEMPEPAPMYVELDFQDGGTYHQMTACGESAEMNITRNEYAEAARSLSWDVDLLTQRVKKIRRSKSSWTDRLGGKL